MYVYSFKMDWAEAPPTLYPKSEFSISKEEDGVKISGNINVFDESYNYDILLTNVSDEDYEFLKEDIKNENEIIMSYLKEHVKRELRVNRNLWYKKRLTV